jgi:hypothetical protein
MLLLLLGRELYGEVTVSFSLGVAERFFRIVTEDSDVGGGFRAMIPPGRLGPRTNLVVVLRGVIYRPYWLRC